VGLVFLLIGGVALYFSGRAYNWLGVGGSLVLLAVPFLLFFGVEVEGRFHDARVWLSNRKFGRYPEAAQRELARAVDAGDFAAMRRILATHPNLTGRNSAGVDLLAYAVTVTNGIDPGPDGERRVEAARLLLEAGMDPNQATDAYGTTIFSLLSHSLTDAASARIFRLFLEHGANANGSGKEEPPIFDAWENPESVRALLDHGATLDIRNKNDDTPLLFYLWNGRWDAALLALDRGAGIHVQNKQGVTPEIALENQRAMAGQLREALPGGYEAVKAALDRRRAAEGH
jgi:hypothetical protein